MMDNLPTGWIISTLGEICSKPQYGWTSKASHSGTLKYVRTTDISNGKINWEKVPFCSKIPDDTEKYRVQINDILVSRAGSVGVSYRIKKVPFDAVFASYLIRFKPIQNIDPRYIEYYLKSYEYWKSISDSTAGIAIPNVNASKLSQLKIPVAPLNEQRRIVAKLEKLLQKVDACKERLDKIPTILKRFRQSILAAACSGRLTADWRGENSNSEEYPLSWKLDELSTYIQSMKNGIYKPEKYYSHNGVICLRMYNIQDGKIVWKNLKRMLLTSDEVAKYSLKPGDILVNRVNSRELVGKAAIIGAVDEPVIFESKNIRLRLNAKQMAPNYVNYCFMTRIVRDVFEDKAKQTVGMATISQPQIANLILPIPKIDEQNEIIHRVEALFKIADQIEERYKKAKAYVDKLTQSILAKAFRGELVPQDPNDEPASELLKRIKEAKAETETKDKAMRRRRKQ